jgi:hypothetical protein
MALVGKERSASEGGEEEGPVPSLKGMSRDSSLLPVLSVVHHFEGLVLGGAALIRLLHGPKGNLLVPPLAIWLRQLPRLGDPYGGLL